MTDVIPPPECTALSHTEAVGKPLDTEFEVLTLYRPVGPDELALIEASGWREFPPRLPGQPIFYPVTNEEYATQIARDWNVRQSGSGFVTRFQIRAEFAARYPIQKVGGAVHTELWVPADEIPEFNRNIIVRSR
jgi:hypothetical protein